MSPCDCECSAQFASELKGGSADDLKSKHAPVHQLVCVASHCCY